MLYNDRTEIVPNATYLGEVLHSMELANCKSAPVGSVNHKPDDADLDRQLSLSIYRCDVQFETNACAKEMKQPTQAYGHD